MGECLISVICKMSLPGQEVTSIQATKDTSGAVYSMNSLMSHEH
jgi:hypothetical protein